MDRSPAALDSRQEQQLFLNVSGHLQQIHDLCPIYATIHSESDHEPHPNGILWQWTVNRTTNIGRLFSRIKSQQVRFLRAADCGSFLDEIASVVTEYNESSRTHGYVQTLVSFLSGR